MSSCVPSIVFRGNSSDTTGHYQDNRLSQGHGSWLTAQGQKKHPPRASELLSKLKSTRGIAVLVPIRREAWERRIEAKHQWPAVRLAALPT